MIDCSMEKRYEIVDMMGRRWDTTMTAARAVKIAARLEVEKGLKCQVKEFLIGGNSNGLNA